MVLIAAPADGVGPGELTPEQRTQLYQAVNTASASLKEVGGTIAGYGQVFKAADIVKLGKFIGPFLGSIGESATARATCCGRWSSYIIQSLYYLGL